MLASDPFGGKLEWNPRRFVHCGPRSAGPPPAYCQRIWLGIGKVCGGGAPVRCGALKGRDTHRHDAGGRGQRIHADYFDYLIYVASESAAGSDLDHSARVERPPRLRRASRQLKAQPFAPNSVTSSAGPPISE